jgi:hypothetical protein
MAEIVKMSTDPVMNILVVSKVEIGTGGGSVDDTTPELVSKQRGEWGNLWKDWK